MLEMMHRYAALLAIALLSIPAAASPQPGICGSRPCRDVPTLPEMGRQQLSSPSPSPSRRNVRIHRTGRARQPPKPIRLLAAIKFGKDNAIDLESIRREPPEYWTKPEHLRQRHGLSWRAIESREMQAGDFPLLESIFPQLLRDPRVYQGEVNISGTSKQIFSTKTGSTLKAVSIQIPGDGADQPERRRKAREPQILSEVIAIALADASHGQEVLESANVPPASSLTHILINGTADTVTKQMLDYYDLRESKAVFPTSDIGHAILGSDFGQQVVDFLINSANWIGAKEIASIVIDPVIDPPLDPLHTASVHVAYSFNLRPRSNDIQRELVNRPRF